MTRSIRWGLAALSVALVAASCGSSSKSSSSATAGTQITLVTHDSFNTSKGLLDQFTAATGIKVKVLQTGDAGQLVNGAILAAGKPQGDVLYGIDNTLLSRGVDKKLFVNYKAAGLDKVPDALKQLVPNGEATPIDFGDVCLNYDKAYFASKNLAPPEKLDDLIDPKYKNLLVTEDPSTSSPGLAFLLATIVRHPDGSAQPWTAWWTALKANGVKVVSGWEQAYTQEFSGSSGHGNYPLVVSYASSPPYEVIAASPPPADAPTGVIADTCFRQIEFAGVLRGTKHEAAAQKFVDFMLSLTFQNDMPLNMYVFPSRTDATLPAEFTKYTVVPSNPIVMDPKAIETGRDGWVAKWTDTVLK